MRILVHSYTPVCPFYDGTALRTFHVTPYLAARHDIDLIEERWPWEAQRRPLGLPDYPDDWRQRYYQHVWTVRHLEPERTRYGHFRESSELYPLLDSLLARGSYDIVWSTSDYLPLYFHDRRRNDQAVLCGPTDSAHLQYAREIRLTRSLPKVARVAAKWMLYALYQVRILNAMPYWTMVGERDAANMRHLSPRSEIRVIPYGVDTDRFAPPEGQARNPLSVVFAGTLGPSGANEPAITWFVRNVWPTVVNRVADATLTIVGRGASPSLLKLADGARGVRVTGWVPDVRPYLWQCGIFVVPMRSGAGIKNKLLEAWAAGCSVMGTRLGVEGVDSARNKENVLIQDRSEEMAMAIVDLMRNPLRQREISEAGRSAAILHYDWRGISAQLEEYLVEIVRRHDGRPSGGGAPS